ncbi:MAG: hypothetical protein BWK80_32585 [Desulfobacteraceae bacterium IS3]|jgi:hypothetical protein|nr:MAG: hypothetical protein BWK80_32585 [Desulfobacteraceae bacterium IS3]HAO20356.1 hypothetical protein [Desulfobacteraceae bacterium]
MAFSVKTGLNCGLSCDEKFDLCAKGTGPWAASARGCSKELSRCRTHTVGGLVYVAKNVVGTVAGMGREYIRSKVGR